MSQEDHTFGGGDKTIFRDEGGNTSDIPALNKCCIQTVHNWGGGKTPGGGGGGPLRSSTSTHSKTKTKKRMELIFFKRIVS